MLLLIVLAVLVVLFFGGRGTSYGAHPYYGPSFGIVGTIVLILVVLWLLGYVHI